MKWCHGIIPYYSKKYGIYDKQFYGTDIMYLKLHIH